MANSFATFPGLTWGLYSGASKTLIAQYNLAPPPSGFSAFTQWTPVGAFGTSNAITADGVVIDNQQGSNSGYLVVGGTTVYQQGATTIVIPAYQKVSIKLSKSTQIITLDMASHGLQNLTTTQVTFYHGDYPGAFDAESFYSAIVGGTLFQNAQPPAQNINAFFQGGLTTVGTPFTLLTTTGGSGVNQFYLESMHINISGASTPAVGGSDFFMALAYAGTTFFQWAPSFNGIAANGFGIFSPNSVVWSPRAILGVGGGAVTLATSGNNFNNNSGTYNITLAYQLVNNVN